MLPRVLEPEALDTFEDASAFEAMDHSSVNERFVADVIRASGGEVRGPILDVGTGTARIPIELCRAVGGVEVVATDLSLPMLEIAVKNVDRAGFSRRITLKQADAKQMREADASFATVISNTIIHHIPEPGAVIREMVRVLQPGGLIFVRDLVRPETTRQVDWFVRRYAGEESEYAQRLFRDSFFASLTLTEVRQIVAAAGCDPLSVRMSSNRHWTWCWRRPG